MKIFDQVVHIDHQLFYLYLFWYIESANNLESIRESYLNTVNELNMELLAMKEQYEQLENRSDQILSKFLMIHILKIFFTC
jgi:hypothetical protein